LAETPARSDLAETLVRYLRNHHTGVDNACSAADLCAYLRIGERELRELRDEVEGEHPVLSLYSVGYWYATSDTEYEETLRQVHSVLKAQARRYSRLRKCRNARWPNRQKVLF